MALIHSLEKNGIFLFRYRGQFPLLLYVVAIPVIYITDYKFLNSNSFLKTSLTILCFSLTFFGLLIRTLSVGTTLKSTSGRNKHKQEAENLNTEGFYSVVRHPLYLGNYFMWFGIILFTFNLWFFICSTLIFWIYYERIMFAEERYLERKFGDRYVNWSNKIPAIIPDFKNFKKTKVPFSIKSFLRREYPGISASIISFLLVDFIRDCFEVKSIRLHFYQIVLLIFSLLFSLILRTLKHYTKILTEEGRS